jgi:uncharacterized UBP type Zn finger protein
LLKVNNHIDFELNNLKLNEFMEQPQASTWKSCSYELYAICIHIGDNMEQGHYTCKFRLKILFKKYKIEFNYLRFESKF